jgi:uncharacterized protein YcbK (DUF882 family)
MKNYNLTKNFTLYEMAFILTKQGNEWNKEALTDEVIKNLTAVANELERLRVHLGNKPIKITSGFRCHKWEIFRKRSGKSQHMYGLAVDLVCDDLDKAYKLYHDQKWMGGLAKGNGFIHLDLRKPEKEHVKRGYGARWVY